MSVQTLPKRSDVPVELTWDLTSVYSGLEAWEADFREVESLLPLLAKFAGTLANDATTLLDFFNLRNRVSQKLEKLFVFASMRSDEDTTISANQALKERARILVSKYSSTTSFVEPELLKIEGARLDEFLAGNAELGAFAQELANIRRKAPYTRSAEVEDVLARGSRLYSGPGQSYDLFCDADMKRPVLSDGKGNRIQLSDGNYGEVFLSSPLKRVRRRAYQAMLGGYHAHRNTIASLYANYVNTEMFLAQVKGYPSTRAMRLGENNIPLSVYDNLISTVRAHIPSMNRYMQMRKRQLGVRKLNFCDLYVPLVQEVDFKPTYEQAKETVLAALAPLGAEYVAALRAGYEKRWVDVVESENKASGAYSGGGYLTAPYMLMNWQDTLESMFTLAHESGHSMQSYRTRKAQPYQYADYTLFVAEVASTLNEALLAHYLLSQSKDKEMRRFIINHQLENIRTTLFRQTLFAEFEQIAHARAEAGEVLTPDLLCEIYRGLVQQYYGDVVEMDELIAIEWARIPHFYNHFYVYQYATGISAAWSLAKQIIEEGEPAVKRYLEFLSSGCSDYSINLLQKAGVDLSSPQPVAEAFAAFEQYLAEFEKLSEPESC